MVVGAFSRFWKQGLTNRGVAPLAKSHRLSAFFLALPPLCWALLLVRLQGFYPSSTPVQLVLFLGAMLSALVASHSLDLPQPSRRTIWAALAAFLLCWLLRLHSNCLYCASLLLAGSVLASIRPGRKAFLEQIGQALLCNGAIATLMTLLLPVLEKVWICFRYRTGVLGDLSRILLSFLTDASELPNGNLFIKGVQQLWEFQTYFESFAFGSAFLLVSVGFFACILGTLRARDFFLGILLLCIAAVLRYVTLVLLFLEIDNMGWWWHPLPTLLFFAGPVVYCVNRLRIPPGSQKASFRSLLVPGGILFGLLAAFFFLTHWSPAGPAKAGRVVFDEYHSGWERTDRVMDTEWYGRLSSYNYSDMYRYLGEFFNVGRLEEPITDQRLSGIDVLVVKTPTEPYQQEEIDALERFVRNGGGLWLIGDHTNIMGMTSYINPIAESFGMRFGHDAVYDLRDGHLQKHFWKTRMRHPIVGGMPDFLWGTSCSLWADVWGEHVMVGRCTRAVPLDYGRKGFFAESHLSPTMEYGLTLQIACKRVGKGRVAAFTDSTVLSNFWFFFPGKRHLAYSTVEWLNHANAPGDPWMKRLLAAITILAYALLVAYLSSGFSTRIHVTQLVLGLLLAHQLGCGVSALFINNRGCEIPVPPRPADRLYLYFNGSDIELPVIKMAGKNSYATWFLAAQRLQIDPIIIENLDSLDGVRGPLAVVNPRNQGENRSQFMSDALIDDILKRCREGQDLLVLYSKNDAGFLARLMKELGIGLVAAKEPDSVILNCDVGVKIEKPVYLQGACKELLRSEGNGLLAGQVTLGKGSVTVATVGHLFSGSYMGPSNKAPNKEQRAVLQLVYDLDQLVVRGTPLPQHYKKRPVYSGKQTNERGKAHRSGTVAPVTRGEFQLPHPRSLQ